MVGQRRRQRTSIASTLLLVIVAGSVVIAFVDYRYMNLIITASPAEIGPSRSHIDASSESSIKHPGKASRKQTHSITKQPSHSSGKAADSSSPPAQPAQPDSVHVDASDSDGEEEAALASIAMPTEDPEDKVDGYDVPYHENDPSHKDQTESEELPLFSETFDHAEETSTASPDLRPENGVLRSRTSFAESIPPKPQFCIRPGHEYWTGRVAYEQVSDFAGGLWEGVLKSSLHDHRRHPRGFHWCE